MFCSIQKVEILRMILARCKSQDTLNLYRTQGTGLLKDHCCKMLKFDFYIYLTSDVKCSQNRPKFHEATFSVSTDPFLEL